MPRKPAKPRPNVFAKDYAPYGAPPPGVRGSPETWRAAFQERIKGNPTLVEEILGDDDPWSVLGLKTGATPDEIRTAYRKMSMKTHPDMGGSQEAFERVNAAYVKLGGK